MDNQYVTALQAAFEPYRNHENAVKMKGYMRDLFEFLGIKTPERRKVLKQFIKEHGKPDDQLFDVINELWELPEREYQMIALDLMDIAMKSMEKDWINQIEALIVSKSWWDTVDGLAAGFAGEYFRKFPGEIDRRTRQWIHSDNMWLQRSAILFQLHYKQETDVDRLFEYINLVADSGEFFIQKAIGWALRELSKTDPEAVVTFVNSTDLKPLSRREALKYLKSKNRM